MLILLTVLIPNVSAQFTTDGFYRIQNYGTKRYLYLTDNTGLYDMKRDVGDFGALQLYTGQERTISDPACILYIKKYGTQIDIQGQGVGIYQIVNRYVDLRDGTGSFKGTYTVSATEAGITKYLDDEETSRDFDTGVVGTNRSSPYRNWLIHPVSSSDDNYFGISPLFFVKGKYYYPFYAAFPFKVASSGMKVYKVGKYDIELGYAVLSEVTGVVPARTPVLIECSSDAASNNRLDLVESSDSPLSGNCLNGVFFCNFERRGRSSAAITAYNADKMRVIGKTSEGNLGFIKSTQYLKQIEGNYYLPSNTSYMNVPSDCPSELTAIPEAEYNEIVANHPYTITYMIDGKVYKTEKLKPGQTINADTPTREGYNFSGWSGLPATMPAQSITVTGSFIPVNFTITYVLDGTVYKVVPVPCGSSITPLTVTKEGYVFSGWNGLPTTMPAHDITVTGSFTIGSYKLIYMIDGVVYQTQTLTYGAAITPLDNPTREGYTFSGWSSIPATMPDHDVTITGSYTSIVYTLRYMIDGELYQEMQVPCGQTITPPTPPEKEGCTFKEWGGLPSVMPAADLIVTAVYEANKYVLTYVVDGAVYKTIEVAYGTLITPIDYPVKEGYVFSGWSGMPEKMPAADVTVSGTFTIGSYTLQYIINVAEYKNYVYYSRKYKFGQSITPYTRNPFDINGYTFIGWGETPTTMPGHDVNVYANYKGKDYTITYILEGVEYQKMTVACGDTIPELIPVKTGYSFSGWKNLPITMPARNITVTGQFSINSYVLEYVLEMGKKGGIQPYYSESYTYGEEITPLTSAPSVDGYTFIGWGEIPSTMPAKDVTVVGKYEANIYKVYYYIGKKLVYQQEVAYQDSIPPYTFVSDTLIVKSDEWKGAKYDVMPAEDVKYTSPKKVAIDALYAEEEEEKMRFDLSGRQVSAMKAKGIYIVNGRKILKQ